jgi:outer membrane protein assembly factor BamB
MRFFTRFAVASLLLSPFAAVAADPVSGWRGNQTGLWPDAKPPLEWHRIPRGALDGMRASAAPPKDKEPGDAPPVLKGLLREWLVIGPFAVDDSEKNFDHDALGGEAMAEPAEGKKVGEVAWKAVTGPADDVTVFGTAELPFLDLVKAVGFKKNQFAYAHTFIYSPRGGPVRFVAEHAQGMKAWLNGKEVYREPNRGTPLGYYTAISKYEISHTQLQSPRFEAELKPGWNRLLLKVRSAAADGASDMRVCVRVMDPPDVKYDTKNIVWMAPLPARSTSTPILVGDRIFVLAEPDEILCIDKNSGKTLWSQFVNYYETVTADEKKANSAYAEKVDPLVAKLKAETDRAKRRQLRAEIQKALLAIDAERFKLHTSGHFEGHFGIVGFTMPTPVSDGKHVYVWNGMGVAACFDLDGKRQWATRIKTDHLNYGSSPALVDGVLVVFLNSLYGLDAKTGKQKWEQKQIRYNVASLIGAAVAGKPVVVTQRGDIVRASDGEIMFRQEGSSAAGDTGWSPPVVVGSRMYLPKYGVAQLSIWDMNDADADLLEPKKLKTIQLPSEINRGPGGKWVDRWTAGSPLIHNSLAYEIDIYQWLYVSDLKTGKMLYRKETELEGFTHYNAVAVAASPTLVGKNVLLCDNQGTTLVLEPGPAYKVLARNRIGTVLERPWPVPSQETLTYSPPIADGNRLYLRGEAYLYCIGEK